MKSAALISFIVLSVFLFSVIEAAPELRQKRALIREHCPKNTTPEECKNYAEAFVKNNCITYYMGNDSTIAFASCGAVACGGLFIKTEVDLTKPYPECCPTCKKISEKKPAEASDVL